MKDKKEIIEKWMKISKNYDPQLQLKKISKLNKKKMSQEAKLKMNDDGRIIISKRKKPYINLDEFRDPYKYYNDLYFFIYSIKSDIIDTVSRENYIKFTYSNSDPKIHKMSTIHFVYNMIMWLPFFILDIPINKSKVFMPKHFTNLEYKNYINNKIIEPYKNLTTLNQMSEILAKMYDLFQRISDLYATDLGISFSMYDIIHKWDNQELYEISHTKIDPKFQIAEMESFLNKQTKRFMQIWSEIEDEPNDSLKTMIRVGQMNNKQLRECVVNIGTKPDLNGNTYAYKPSPGSNLLVNGLRDNAYIYDATGGRKAAVLSLNIDEGGYMARAFGKTCSDIVLCEDPDFDCGSENYYICQIKNKEDLKNMRGRWYLNEKTNTLRQLIETDYDVIGETLKFRSPAMCAGGERGICHTCYGHLASQNTNIHAGINSALFLSESNYQLIMSVKHVLNTNTEYIHFCDEFNKFFLFEDGYRIGLRNDLYDTYEDDLEIWININSINKDKDIDDLNHNEYIKDFIIYDKFNKTKIKIYEFNKTELYLANQLFDKIKEKRKNKEYNSKGYIKINMSDFSTNRDLFFIRLKNDEITKSLREIKSLIEKGGDIGIHDASELINKLKDLMSSGGIKTETIHIEILCRNLIRDAHNKISLPDWSKKDPEYIITSMHNSIFLSSSVINSLTFEKIKNQFKDPMTYKKRGTSFLDPCFILDYNNN